MSFIVKTWTPEFRTRSFSRSSRLRTPIRAVCSGEDRRSESADRRQLDRLGPQQCGQRHAVNVAAWRARRRVHVPVSIDPEKADRLSGGACMRRRRCDRSRRQAVIAPEHERHRALLDRCARDLIKAFRRPWRCLLMNFFFGSPSFFVSGIGEGRSPRSATDRPSPAIFSRVRRCGTPTAPYPHPGGCRPYRGARRSNGRARHGGTIPKSLEQRAKREEDGGFA